MPIKFGVLRVGFLANLLHSNSILEISLTPEHITSNVLLLARCNKDATLK